MLQPIHKDHESCCPNCGCVLANIDEVTEYVEKSTIQPSADIFILGTHLANSKIKFKDPQQVYEDRVLKELLLTVKRFDIPERLAIETFQILKKKRRGFQSKTQPAKHLLQLLAKDDNYHLFYKAMKLKAWYESISSG